MKDEYANVELNKYKLESYAQLMGQYLSMADEEHGKPEHGSEEHLRGVVAGMRVALEWLGFSPEARRAIDEEAERKRSEINRK